MAAMGGTDGDGIETLSGDPTLVLPEFDDPPGDLDDPAALRRKANAVNSSGEPLRRPPRWGGFRLDPDLIEFWHGSPDRLHRRLLYVKQEGLWTHQRLQP
jgi:hypothetical protein